MSITSEENDVLQLKVVSDEIPAQSAVPGSSVPKILLDVSYINKHQQKSEACERDTQLLTFPTASKS